VSFILNNSFDDPDVIKACETLSDPVLFPPSKPPFHRPSSSQKEHAHIKITNTSPHDAKSSLKDDYVSDKDMAVPTRRVLPGALVSNMLGIYTEFINAFQPVLHSLGDLDKQLHILKEDNAIIETQLENCKKHTSNLMKQAAQLNQQRYDSFMAYHIHSSPRRQHCLPYEVCDC
jgi:hypothetical protein